MFSLCSLLLKRSRHDWSMENPAITPTFRPVDELRWLFVDLNSYVASVEQHVDASLRGRPVAVVPVMTDATCAIAASYEAKKFGIKTGTKIFEAKKLCPDLVCVLARHDLYVEYHHRIFDVVEQVLPVTKICSVDEAACRLLGTECQPAQAIALANAIKTRLVEKIGPAISCSIGIAPNAFLAKVASDLQKPNGLVLLEPDGFQEQLFALKLTDLPGINLRMEHRLNRAGIHTVEQFWNVPPRHARLIWGGIGGERFWYRLHGYEIPDAATHKSVIGHSRVLDPDHRHPDRAFNITHQLMLKAAARLRKSGYFARRLQLSCKTPARHYWTAERSFSPTQDSFMFLRSLRILWDAMLGDLQRGALQQVSVTLSDLSEAREVTLDLFTHAEPKLSMRGLKLSQSVDALNKRFGIDTVTLGLPLETNAGHLGTKIAFNRVPDREWASDLLLARSCEIRLT